MDRRSFLRGLLAGSAAVMAPERVYSFLTNNPLARDGYEFRLGSYGNLLVSEPGRVMLSFNDALKMAYPNEITVQMNPKSALVRIFSVGQGGGALIL